MEFKVLDLGLVDYSLAWQKQKDVFTEVKNGDRPSTLILCQHHPVITLGRMSKKENILASSYALKSKGIEVREIERGGDVTYHGPGQLTAYPVFNLTYLKKDIHLFLRNLEDTIIEFLAGFSIKGERRDGLTGVWIGKQKIASIGIAIKNWITFHGLSININKEDLINFTFIRPCGMDIKMTSLENALYRDIEIDNVKDKLVESFRRKYGESNLT